MIGIIDYGMGNLGSVSNAFNFLKIPARILSTPDKMVDVDAVVLPGVGAFGDCMQHMHEHGFSAAVVDWIEADKPFLGICLGLQVLFERSEESPGVAGLGVLPGEVRLFPGKGLKVPQIGWNGVCQVQGSCPLFWEIDDEAYFYSVHSYYVENQALDTIAGSTNYGLTYTSAVWKNRMAAVQFHPEKSQKIGLRMLQNFGTWVDS